MSRFECLLVRAALVHLVLTGALGVLFFIQPMLAGYFRTTHIHLGVLGFFLSLVMGVAYWMMPRPGGLRQERLEAVTFFLLHGGLLLRAFAEPWWRFSGDAWARPVLVGSGFLLLGAICVFAFAMNQRVVTAEQVRAARARMSRAAPARSTGGAR